MPEPIIIVGAGMGGLTAALAMLQRNVPVRVFEDAPELGDVGAGLTLGSFTRRVIDALGLIDVLADEVVTVNGVGRGHYQTGEILTRQDSRDADWKRDGPYTWYVHRADLHKALSDAVRAIDPDCIFLDHQLAGFEQDGEGVTARFANGATARGRGLVGADGLRSTTRTILFGPENPRFSGIVSWRGLVPMERLTPGLLDPDAFRFIGSFWRFFAYPVRHRTLMNYVATVARQTWQVESWKEHSEVAEVLAQFEGGAPAIHEIVRNTPPELCYKWALFDRDVLPRWSVGRVTLLGDAAHPMLPFLGAGAGLAMEDGLVLARCVEMDADIEGAFARYERNRKPRTDAAQLAARDNGVWPFDKYFPNDASATVTGDRVGRPAHYDAEHVPLV